MESLRLALVSDWFLPRAGGVEVSIHELASGLSRRGHEVFIVTHPNAASGTRPTLETTRDGYTVYWIPSRLAGADEVTADPLTVARALLFIKRNAFDIVHSHGISSTLSLFTAMIASGGTGVPSLLTNHSLLSESIPVPARRLLRYALKWPTVLTGVSRAAAADLEAISGRSAVVTPNCINVRAWREAAQPIDLEGDPVVVITSRLSKRKNPLEVARVAELVTRRLPRATFYVIGDGALGPSLRAELSRRGLERRVKMLGIMPRSQVARVLAAADFFALTSYKESFGLAVLEAMAVGAVPVVYRSPGVVDLVSDGEVGLVVDGADSMADAIVRAYEDQDMYRRLSEGAERRSELFDCDNVIDRYVMPTYASALEGCEASDRRFLVYKLYRWVVRDPVRPGEWCRGRKWLYHERAREGIVPVVRRRA